MATTFEMLQWIILYGTAIVFSCIALDRETMLSSIFSAFLWLISAIFTFILSPTLIGITLGWVFGSISFIFCGVFIFRLLSEYFDGKHKRYEVGPL